jgi:hypothetical protein
MSAFCINHSILSPSVNCADERDIVRLGRAMDNLRAKCETEQMIFGLISQRDRLTEALKAIARGGNESEAWLLVDIAKLALAEVEGK